MTPAEQVEQLVRVVVESTNPQYGVTLYSVMLGDREQSSGRRLPVAEDEVKRLRDTILPALQAAYRQGLHDALHGSALPGAELSAFWLEECREVWEQLAAPDGETARQEVQKLLAHIDFLAALLLRMTNDSEAYLVGRDAGRKEGEKAMRQEIVRLLGLDYSAREETLDAIAAAVAKYPE